nr:immunoglobulin heavy chain junction region [Macaca mulatta]MOV38752.1 immunoglobulin heavy chain junction region [Macaca mulatta]MOV38806.1 immunoglobulin heavy chain junction region [Macaca mulatta]MOV39727.1 immunoglobulin heavy chain junction region [Macaca mulatta]MOV45104.1 immunoglobulin heavy chain junction region [Macaca mulatta]
CARDGAQGYYSSWARFFEFW